MTQKLKEDVQFSVTRMGVYLMPGVCSFPPSGEMALMAVLKDIPSLAVRNTFVDPIVFCIWEGDMTHSVCYRKPTTVRLHPILTLLMIGNGASHVVFDSKRDWNRSLHPSCEYQGNMRLMDSISIGRKILYSSMKSRRVGIIRERHSSSAARIWSLMHP